MQTFALLLFCFLIVLLIKPPFKIQPIDTTPVILAFKLAIRVIQPTTTTPMLKINPYVSLRYKTSKNCMAVGIAVCCKPTRGSNCNPVSFSCYNINHRYLVVKSCINTEYLYRKILSSILRVILLFKAV